MVESGVFCLPLASVDFVATKSDICTDIQYVERIVNIFAEDIDGATYFFLPSYIRLSSLDYTGSYLKIFTEGGEFLTKPVIKETLI